MILRKRSRLRPCLWRRSTTCHPLTGEESLIERFYDKTTNDRSHWAQLFDYVGRSLKKSGDHLDKPLIDRIIAFFNWRLRSYSKILDLKGINDIGLFLEVKTLNKLIPDNLPLVIECFAKMTDAMDQGNQMYISANEAKPILKAGLNAEDPQVRENAERAKENLLRLGHFGYLDINIDGGYDEVIRNVDIKHTV